MQITNWQPLLKNLVTSESQFRALNYKMLTCFAIPVWNAGFIQSDMYANLKNRLKILSSRFLANPGLA